MKNNYILFLILFFALFNTLAAQKDSTVYTSLCIQNAYTLEPELNASILLEYLNDNNQPKQADSMFSEKGLPIKLKIGQKYKISVQKEGFYPADSIFTPIVISKSNKQRLGIYLKPIVCYHVRGKIANAITSTKISAGSLTVKDLSNNKMIEAVIKNGYYEFCGVGGHTYQVTTKIDNHFEQSQEITLNSDNRYTSQEQEKILDLTVAESYPSLLFQGDSVTIHDFRFVEKTASLSKEGEQEVAKLIQVLKLMPELKISIAIHTDPSNSHRFNRILSEKRVEIVRQKLVAAGISPDRLEFWAKGEEEAIFKESKKNNRACLWITKTKK